MEVLLNLIIKQGENQHPAPATSPAPVVGTLTRDPPESWYADVGLTRTAARYLWWGLSPTPDGHTILLDAAI